MAKTDSGQFGPALRFVYLEVAETPDNKADALYLILSQHDCDVMLSRRVELRTLRPLDRYVQEIGYSDPNTRMLWLKKGSLLPAVAADLFGVGIHVARGPYERRDPVEPVHIQMSTESPRMIVDDGGVSWRAYAATGGLHESGTLTWNDIETLFTGEENTV